MSNVYYSPLGRLLDWSIRYTLGGHAHLWCHKRQIFKTSLITANHTHTWWHLMGPLTTLNHQNSQMFPHLLLGEWPSHVSYLSTVIEQRTWSVILPLDWTCIVLSKCIFLNTSSTLQTLKERSACGSGGIAGLAGTRKVAGSIPHQGELTPSVVDATVNVTQYRTVLWVATG